MQQPPSVMQNLVDSLCQCFSGSPQSTELKSFRSHDEVRSKDKKSTCPATPDMKRRTRSLALNENQWDALFDGTCAPRRNRSSTLATRTKSQESTLEQAHAVAKAKWAAKSTVQPLRKGNSPSSKHRKRTRSRDDIFRSKREPPPNTTNVLSRFLTNHPAIMNSLCFATPIRGDSFDCNDAASVVSDSNTLNTAEDTITSTLYYETTKLAGLKQKNPPMPLFTSHAVEAKDDINTIVATRSHSSFKNTYQHSADDNIELDEDEPTPPSSPHHYNFESTTRTNGNEEVPPPVTKLSSDSSKS